MTLEGITLEQLWQRPAPSEWSIGEILNHNTLVIQSMLPMVRFTWRWLRCTSKLFENQLIQTEIEDPYHKQDYPHWEGFLWRPKYSQKNQVPLLKLLEETRNTHREVRDFFERKKEPVLGHIYFILPVFGIFNPDTIYPSEVSRLTINVFNPNPSELTEVNWVNQLPDDLIVVDPVDPMVTGCGGSYTITADPGTNVISLSGATTDGTSDPVNPGICSVTVSVTSFEVGNHTNVIDRTDGSATIDGNVVNYEYDANITLLVLPIVSPEISKSFTSPINVGDISQMEINIENNDPNIALTEVELEDTLPAGMFVSDPLTISLSNCGSGTLDPIAVDDTEVHLTGASIAVGLTCQIRVNVETTGTGTFTNTISPEDLTTYQKVTIPSDVTADLVVKNVELDKEFNPTNFEAGGSGLVTITITNPDLENPLTGVTFTDNLPENLTVVEESGGIEGIGCLGVVDTSNPTQIVLTEGTIPAGSSC